MTGETENATDAANQSLARPVSQERLLLASPGKNKTRNGRNKKYYANGGCSVTPETNGQAHLSDRMAAAVPYDETIVVELGVIDECANRCLMIDHTMSNETERTNHHQQSGNTD